MFDARSYTVDRATGLLDLDALRAQVHEVRPLILLAGYSAYPRKIDFARMREIADEVGATFMVDMAHFAGLVAGKVFTGAYDPVPHAHVVTSTTHKTLRGPRGGLVLSQRGVRRRRRQGLPRRPRWSAAARHGGQGDRAAGGQPARVPRVRRPHRRERPYARGERCSGTA